MTKEEKLERRRQHYLANRERMLAEAADYRSKHPDKVKAARQRWYAENGAADARARYRADPERSLKAATKWKAKNPDYHREYALAAYYADLEGNRAKLRERRNSNLPYHRRRVGEWFKANPGKVRDIARRRRARKIAATVEQFDEIEIFERDGWRCYICERPVSLNLIAHHPERAILEHVIPLAKGGLHSRANTKCACFRCNAVKGSHLTPEQTRQRLGLSSPAYAGTPPDLQAQGRPHKARSHG